jgi:hypothetical protein
LVTGYLNKQIAATLGITEVTVQIHRGRIMRKMAAPSFADLVRMSSLVGIPERANSSSLRVPTDELHPLYCGSNRAK